LPILRPHWFEGPIAPSQDYGYKALFRHIDCPNAAEDAKRGSNRPCTCASGRKWKQRRGTAPTAASRASAAASMRLS
jgi:hypothetical protein